MKQVYVETSSEHWASLVERCEPADTDLDRGAAVAVSFPAVVEVSEAVNALNSPLLLGTYFSV